MRTRILCALFLTVLILGGCAAPTKFAIVYGESSFTSAEAVREAMSAIKNAEASSYRPVSIGGGAGTTNLETGVKVITVYVLMEGPANAPNILATGLPVP